jgi:lysozyme
MTAFLIAIGGLTTVALIGALVSAHLCDLIELAARSHGAGLRAYRRTVSHTWERERGKDATGERYPRRAPTHNPKVEGDSGLVIPGIDVSHYQGEIDWPTLKASGQIDFAFIKATDGSLGIDPSFYRNANQAQSAGVLHGFYHFMRADDVPGQIANVLKVVTQDALETHPLMLDVEVAAITLAQVKQFLAAIPQAILYADRSMLTSWFLKDSLSAIFQNVPLWLAEYGVSDPVVAPWSTWTFWQYGTGRVPGISTLVDLDWFNGSLEDLQKFWKLPT